MVKLVGLVVLLLTIDSFSCGDGSGGRAIIAEERSAAWNSRVSGERGSWWRRDDVRGTIGRWVFVVGSFVDLIMVVVVVDDKGVVGRDLSLFVRWE